MTKAYSYLRFSAKAQAKGDSLRRQTELSEQYAKAHGLTIDSSLKMQDLGVSAFKGSHVEKALGTFFRAVETGRVKAGEFLLVESMDRLGRDEVTVAMQRFLTLINAGVIIVTLQDETLHEKDSINQNPFKLMQSLTEMVRANSESEAKSKRLKASWQNKKNIAHSGKIAFHRCPRWMKWNGEKYILIPEATKSVKAIFDLAINGYGYKGIQKFANNKANGIEPIGTSGKWSESSIAKLLNTKSAIGYWHTRQEEIENYYPAAITKETWLKAQASLSRRKTKGGKIGDQCTNLFGGILKVCKTIKPIYGLEPFTETNTCTARIVNKQNRKYITASHAVRGIGDWKYFGILYEEVEKAILFWIQQLDLDTVFGGTNKDAEQLQTFKDELLTISDRLDAITEGLVNGGAVEALQKAAVKLEVKKQLLTDQIESLQALQATPTAESATELVRLIESVQRGDKATRMMMRERIRQVIQNIYLTIGTTGKAHKHERFAVVQVILTNGEKDQFIVNTDGLGGGNTMYGAELATGKKIGFIVEGNLESYEEIELG